MYDAQIRHLQVTLNVRRRSMCTFLHFYLLSKQGWLYLYWDNDWTYPVFLWQLLVKFLENLPMFCSLLPYLGLKQTGSDSQCLLSNCSTQYKLLLDSNLFWKKSTFGIALRGSGLTVSSQSDRDRNQLCSLTNLWSLFTSSLLSSFSLYSLPTYWHGVAPQ